MIPATANPPHPPPVRLALRGIGIRLGGARILEGIDLEARGGEVLAVAGEDGAGKSTLLKILGGTHADYEGSLAIDGAEVRFSSPTEAAQHGIAVVQQGLTLVPSMTVADNLFLGRSLTRAGFVSDRAQREKAGEVLDLLEVPVAATATVEELPRAHRQLVEFARAWSMEARVIALDEPCHGLGDVDAARLPRMMQRFRSRGAAILVATHRVEEIGRMADRVMVLRSGRCLVIEPVGGLSPERLTEWITGRASGNTTPAEAITRERTRIARNIHDDLGARLTQISLLCELGMRRGSDGVKDPSRAHFQAISETAREVAQAMDAIIWAINPRNDSLENLAGYLAQFAERFFRLTSIRCRCDLPGQLPPRALGTDARHSLFLAVREALNNTARHSRAHEVWLRLAVDDYRLRIRVEDDGVGFAEDVPGRGNGLRNMESRMRELGGKLEIDAGPGRGTRIGFELPLRGA